MAQDLRGSHVGGWGIEEYLGNGFSAVVLSATKRDSRGAIKIIDPEMIERNGFDRQLARINREKLLVGHTHPNLVKILDSGHCEKTGYLFVVMELLEPLTLGEVRCKLPRTRIGPVICQLASAARFLEELGLVHRDIKPENTHISSDFMAVKLLDLGVVYPPQESSAPSAGTHDSFVGTARYSPPEFLRRQEENSPKGWRAVTFYQLGATLFDLITGAPIFDDVREPPARLYEAIKDDVPLIDPTDNDVEPWLVDLARRCLIKDWRIREQLVTWEHFSGPRPAPESSEEIRSRIRARSRSDSPSSRVRSHSPSGRTSRRMFEDLFRNMGTMIRGVCQKGDEFPPIEIHPDYATNGLTIRMRCGPLPEKELLGILELEFKLLPLGQEVNDVRVLARVHLLPTGSQGISSPCEELDEIFVGDVSSMEFRELMDVFVHASLESAQGAGDPIGNSVQLVPNWR